MDQWKAWLQEAAESLGPLAPRLLGAGALLLGAWLLARLARAALLRLGTARRLDERLRSPGMAALLARIAYWLVWLFALPPLLGALELQALLGPVNAMMERLLGALPGLAGALVILGVGLLAGRILREIVSGLLTAAGSEKLAARIGLSSALGERTLAGIAGSVVFLLVLLPTLTAALQALGLEVIAKPVGHLLDSVVELIPRLISAALVVAIGAVLGRLLAGIVSALLAGLGLNRVPEQLGMGAQWKVGGRTPAELAGGIVMAGALLLALAQGCELLGVAVLSEAVAVFGGVFAHLLVALLILGAGLWLGALGARAVEASAVAHARGLGQGLRAVAIFFAAALALRQAGLPADIVSIAFASVFGAAALAFAIAVGFGGREVAARLLERALDSFDARRVAGGVGGQGGEGGEGGERGKPRDRG
ncbi:MAG: mechanosensitive ion channel [Burkholderiales bacterium]|nr:mechanosensitive ion channel [Burkholderiales bacterium]